MNESKPNRTHLKRFPVVMLCGVIGLVIGFSLGRYTPFGPRALIRNPGDYEVQQSFERFRALAERSNEFLRANNGVIPADPYLGFVEAKVVDSFLGFFSGGGVIRFDVMCLPPKVAIPLSKNAKGVFFWVDRLEIGEFWVCYLDGTSERQSLGSFIWPGGPGKRAKAQIEWDRSFHKAGYPYWINVAEKKAWIEKHQDKLIWDAERRFFVPPEKAKEESGD